MAVHGESHAPPEGPHGYAALLGLRTFDPAGLRERVEAGLSYQALERLRVALDLPLADLAELLQIRMRTLSRRKEEGRLRPDESDRLLRASRLLAAAIELFDGDRPAARRWLAAPQEGLGGATPLEYARTDVGCREVENLIGRLEYGIVT